MFLALTLLVLSAAPVESVAQPAPKRDAVGRGLIIGGASAFATTWLASVGAALIGETVAFLPVFPAQTSSLRGLYVPVAGPFIALADRRNQTVAGVTLLVVDGVLQAASVATFILGLVRQVGAANTTSTTWMLVPPPGGAAFALSW